jgi:hypothetical protein
MELIKDGWERKDFFMDGTVTVARRNGGVLRVCAFNLVREGKQRRVWSDSDWMTALQEKLIMRSEEKAFFLLHNFKTFSVERFFKSHNLMHDL